MTQFSADIAGMLEVFAFALGLYFWHLATKENAIILRFASAVLLAGALLVGACTTYYWVKYQQQGAFEATPMNGMHGMMMKGMPMPMGNMGGAGSMPPVNSSAPAMPSPGGREHGEK